MKTIIKFLFTLLILFAFSCSQESAQDPIDESSSSDPTQDIIDPSAYEVKENLTLAQFQAAENATDARYRCSKTKAPVFDVVNGVEAGRAVLLRSRNGVFVHYRATNLTPGHVYTLWWVVWNNPEECATPGQCTDTDFPNFENVKVELMYASGRIARKNGKATFLAYLKENDASGTTNPFFGLPSFGGMLDSKKSEVHAVLRDHGPAIPGQIWDQLTSYEGGCETFFDAFTQIPEAEGECGDIYAAVFEPLFIEQTAPIGGLADITGTSTLRRNKNGITVNFKAEGLYPGAYTIWWVIWNEPQNCAIPGACNEPDFANAVAVEVEVMYAGGQVVGNNGKGNFSGHLKAGDDTPESMNEAFGFPSVGGLRVGNTFDAEVHVVIRTHGPAVPGLINEQIGTYRGGCDDPFLYAPFTVYPNAIGECADIAAAVHSPVN